MNADQQFLETYSQKHITRQEDGSYSLTRCLAQTPNLLKLYDSIITDQHCRGFIEQMIQP